jgi:hypothetical protein
MTIAEKTPSTEVAEKQPELNADLFLKGLIGNRQCLGLLRFFVVHPSGRFSKLAVVHALDENGTRREVENALESLINGGIVKTSVENGTCYYLLTRDEPARHLVLSLAEFDWQQWQRLSQY